MHKTLAIIHTTHSTIQALNALAKKHLGNIRIVNLLDDSILPEINQAGGFTVEVRERFNNLVQNALSAKSDVILSACSSIGPLLEEAAINLDIPAIRIDEAMAKEAAENHNTITVMATVNSTLEPSSEIIRRKANALGHAIHLDTLLIEEAGPLLHSGDFEAYNKLIAGQILEAAKQSSCIVLAQASMASALDYIPEDKLSVPVLTSPVLGIKSLEQYF